MKKIVCSVLACIIAVSLFGMTAFAAGSTTETTEITKAVDQNGAEIDVTVYEASDKVYPTDDELAALLGGGTATVLWFKDLVVAEGTAFPVTLSLHVEGTDGQTLYVLHLPEDSYEWEIVASGEGPSIDATFNSLSPVCVVAKNTAAASEETEAPAETTPSTPASTPPSTPASTTPSTPANTTSSTPANTTTAAPAHNAAASPVTGDPSRTVLLAGVMAIAGVTAAVAAVSRKKAR